MPPRLKPVPRIRQKPQHQHPREPRRGQRQRDGRKIARAQKRDDQERHEENDGRAEILHQRQTSADRRGIRDKQNDVPLRHQPRKRGRADVNEAHLHELRRLERKPAQLDPVARAVFLHAEDQVEHQQPHACHRGQIPHGLRPFQIAQRPANGQKHAHARANRQQLLDQTLRRGARHHRQPHRAQEKRQRLRLKSRPAEDPQPEIQRPFQPDQPAERRQLQRRVAPAEDQLQRRQQLKQRQKQQRRRLPHGAARARARAGLDALLLLRDGHERKVDPAHRDHVAEPQRRQRGLPPVDEHAGFRLRVRDRPAPVVIPRQNRVRARDRRVPQLHVAARAAPNQTFPVRHRDMRPVRRRQPGPDLRLLPERQQTHRAPHQNSQRQHRKHIAQPRGRL